MEALLIVSRVLKFAWQKLVALWKAPYGREVIFIVLVVLAYFIGVHIGRRSVPTITQKQESHTETNANAHATDQSQAHQRTETNTQIDVDQSVHQNEVETVTVQPNGAKRIVIRRVTDSDTHVEEGQQVNVSFDFSRLVIVDTAVSTVSTATTETSVVSTGDAPVTFKKWDAGLIAAVDVKHPLDGVYLGGQVSHYVFTVPWIKVPVYAGGLVLSAGNKDHFLLGAQLHAQF
jgi:hypothetical protein